MVYWGAMVVGQDESMSAYNATNTNTYVLS